MLDMPPGEGVSQELQEAPPIAAMTTTSATRTAK
jgi:hypothetical protein